MSEAGASLVDHKLGLNVVPKTKVKNAKLYPTCRVIQCFCIRLQEDRVGFACLSVCEIISATATSHMA